MENIKIYIDAFVKLCNDIMDVFGVDHADGTNKFEALSAAFEEFFAVFQTA